MPRVPLTKTLTSFKIGSHLTSTHLAESNYMETVCSRGEDVSKPSLHILTKDILTCGMETGEAGRICIL